MEEYDRMLENQEKKRARETAERERKVQEIMNKMGDVLKKDNNEEKKLELKILNEALEKDKKAEKDEQLQKEIKLFKNK